jgi:hypothetical protein
MGQTVVGRRKQSNCACLEEIIRLTSAWKHKRKNVKAINLKRALFYITNFKKHKSLIVQIPHLSSCQGRRSTSFIARSQTQSNVNRRFIWGIVNGSEILSLPSSHPDFDATMKHNIELWSKAFRVLVISGCTDFT